MCEISDKLKLCTCIDKIDELEHFWVLHRFIKGQENFVIGEPMLPNFLDKKTDLKNRNLLLDLLNSGNVFDQPIIPKAKDRLELSFYDGSLEQRITYGFVFKKGKWEEEGYDPLEWMWHHKPENHSKILNPLNKK